MARLEVELDPSGARSGARQIKRDLRDILKDADRTTAGMGKLGTKSASAMNKAGGAVRKFAKDMLVAKLGVIALGAAVAKGFGSAVGLDKALAEASTLLVGTTQEMALMREEATRMAAIFGGGATRQVEAFYQAISAGAGSVEQATTLLQTSNLLAKGGVTGITTAVDILTTATNSYEASNLTAADASDILFTGVKFGKTTIGELASALGRATPLAAKLGIGFDELVGATAALTKGGVSTAEAITGVRGIMAAVLKPTSEAVEMAKKLGLEFNAAAVESKGFAGFLADVIDKTGGSSTVLAQLFGGMEGLSGVLGLAANDGALFNAAMTEMETRLGATQAAADKMTKSLSDRLGVAIGKIGLAFQIFGNVLLKVVVPAIEFVVDNARFLAIAIAGLAATQIPALIAGLTAAAGGMGAMAIATGAFTAAVNIARFATMALGGPLGIVWGLIGAAGAAWILFKENTDDAATGMYDAEAASMALNTQLGLFYLTASPEAGKSAIELANKNKTLAKSALDAAQAELELIKMLNLAASFQLGAVGGDDVVRTSTVGTEAETAAAAKVTEATADLNTARDELDTAATAVTGGMSETMTQTLDVARSLSLEINTTTDSLTGSSEAASTARDAFDSLHSSLDETFAAETAFAEGQAVVSAALDKGVISSEKAATVLGLLKNQYELATNAALQMQEQVADAFANSIGQGLTDMVEGTKTVGEAFKSMARDIISELFQILVVQQLVSGIKGLFGFADGAAFSGGEVTAFASGGVVSSPTLFPMANGTGLMGEAGPEAILPLSRGNDGKLGVKMNGGGGSKTEVTQIFHISTGVAQTVRAEMLDLLPQLKEQTIQAVTDANRRSARA